MARKNLLCSTLAAAAVVLAAPAALADLPAFSSADGAAANVTGGRGGIVYHVTKLDKNYSDTGPGTLRYGLTDSNFTINGVVQARTIVFDVGGVFWLGRFGEEKGHDNGWDSASRLNLGSNVTIAGQTAPGGAYIMGGVVKANGSNTILRNITIAPGYGLRNFAKPEDGIAPTPGDFPDSYVYDAIDISGQNIMIDHVTAVYATDETISANELADNITIQYSNISQAQNYPQADAESDGSIRYTGHGLGSLFQMGSNANLSVHHNLYAHIKGRLPRVGTQADDLTDPNVGAFNDFRNNVFYNWYNTAGTGASTQRSQNNFISNFYLAGDGGDDVTQHAGPDGVMGTSDDFATVTPKSGGTNIFNGDNGPTGVYHTGNVKDINKDGDADDAVALTNGDFTTSVLQGGAYTQTPYYGTTDTAQDAYDRVLDYVGANWWDRSALDQRLINEVRTGTGQIMAWADDPFNNDPNEGTEWRALLAMRADPTTGAAPFNRAAGWDTDLDGMPDAWEVAHNLNPNAANNNADFDNDGYTDLEEYINEIAVIPAPTVLGFTNTNGNGRYAEIGNWATGIWQPSRFDTAQINGGTVAVDAVGQHAGNLTIAANAGDVAQLQITDGWLIVENQLLIGGDPTGQGTLNLTGGALHTHILAKGSAGAFDMTGGELHADIIAFDLINQGGTLAPGHSVGMTYVMGDLTLQSGALQIELEADDSFDTLLVDGVLTLGGQLDVLLLDGYTIEPSERWLIGEASQIEGAFDAITPGFTVEIDGGSLYLTAAPEPGSMSVGLITAAPLLMRRRASHKR